MPILLAGVEVRIKVWQVLAVLAGLVLGGAAYALIPGSQGAIAAGVLVLAGLLAAWPLPRGRDRHPGTEATGKTTGASPERSRSTRFRTGRMKRLEDEIGHLTAAVREFESRFAELRSAHEAEVSARIEAERRLAETEQRLRETTEAAAAEREELLASLRGLERRLESRGEALASASQELFEILGLTDEPPTRERNQGQQAEATMTELFVPAGATGVADPGTKEGDDEY